MLAQHATLSGTKIRQYILKPSQQRSKTTEHLLSTYYVVALP